jgi:dipeptidyl aminopeptidase/acylaminoacyl peptidase
MTRTTDTDSESNDDYLRRLAGAQGVSGYTVTPDGTLVYGGYDDGSYDLYTPSDQLTETDEDVTNPEWLEGRGTLLASRDEGGSEQFDLLEVDPNTGTVTPRLEDRFLNTRARQDPNNPNRVAFLSNRDRSLDLYTLDLEDQAVSKRSETDETVMGYAWSPAGDHLVYQAGTFDDTALRVVDLTIDRDSVFIDEPDSEQSLVTLEDVGCAWSTEGVVFATNHETGYRELAVADSDGDYELRYVNNHDKYAPQWTADGDIVFHEARGGDRQVRRLSDGDVSVVESTGLNMNMQAIDGDVYYWHTGPGTAGDVRRNGETLVAEGAVDVGTTAPDEVLYESFDGTEIAARHYTPDGEPVAGVVKAHGGPESQHYNQIDLITQALVDAGFEVLAPDFRGSLGYGREFRTASDGDLGGDDLMDVAAGAEYLRSHGRTSVGIVGGSYGGYMALMGIGATDAFDAGASFVGIVNWKTAVENARGYIGDALMRKLGGTPDEKPELYEDRSPIAYTDEMDVPLFTYQGANDPRVPESEAEQLVDSLADRNVEHEYLCFEDEGHSLRGTENRIEVFERTLEFFTKHL